ncbi:MAG: PQQ-binding-like beta-propeller repeat protein [Dokdonella sp.]
MQSRTRLDLAASTALICGLIASAAASAQIDVVTERYDGNRLGANLQEVQLTTANVNATNFGKLWAYTVSGSVYAQPLYVRDVAIPGQGIHNVVYVVTMNDWVYAFDADSSVDAPLLSLDLTTEVPGSRANTITEILGYNDNIIGNVGIESTPHIDLASNTIYLVARTRETGANCGPNNPTFCQRLHAIDISTLTEKSGSPVTLGGSVPGHGNGSVGGVLSFDPKIEDQRASLAYSNGRIFVAWAAHSDQFAYHGWVMVYDAATLQQTAIWCSTPDGTAFNGGGIWMAGRAPAVDAQGNVYFITGNGTYAPNTGNFGESIVKFGASADTPMLDWFTPSNYSSLNDGDADLGGSGPILLPGTDLIVGAGKSGVFYVTHATALGHDSANDMNIVQTFTNGGQQIKGGPVYWDRHDGADPWMYVWSDGHNRMKAYRFNTATSLFDTTPASQTTLFSNTGSAGGVLSLSANGSNTGSGILWSSMAFSGSDPNSGIHPGVLRALDAGDLTHELWNSEQMSARDRVGNWPKFSPPTIVDGHVYMGSFPNDGFGTTKVSTYGVLPIPDFSIAVTPPNPGIHAGDSVTYTVTVDFVQGFSGTVHLDATGLPPNASALFAANDFSAPASTTLTVQTDAGMTPGPNQLSVSATDGTLTHAIDAGLHTTSVMAGAGTISVDFVGTGTPMLATEIAGVVAAPNWNTAIGASGAALALVDETGAPSGATITWNAPGRWKPGIADTAGDFHLMNGYLNASGAATSATITGLAADSAGYYVYVYADGDNQTQALTGNYAITGATSLPASIAITDSANANFNGSYVRAENGGGNYAVFFVAGTGFTLTATAGAASGNSASAPLNALQIVHGDRLFADGFDG